VFPDWLVEHASRLTLLLPSSAIPELLQRDVMAGGVVIWSLWPGYLKEPSGERLRHALDDARVPLVLDHASGHAPVVDLQRLCEALKPDRLVPIHTEGAGRYEAFFNDVERHEDGEWWSV
jgi:ribonuclease J